MHRERLAALRRRTNTIESTILPSSLYTGETQPVTFTVVTDHTPCAPEWSPFLTCPPPASR